MTRSPGRVEVICGCMFSGKSEELLRRVRRAQIARQKVQVFKPSIDDRYGLSEVVSHDGRVTKAIALETPVELFKHLDEDTTVVAIDEAQFFDDSIVDVCRALAEDHNVRVIVTGLDLDFRGEPFGSMPALMAEAEEVMKLDAICVVGTESATRSQRLIDGEPAHYDDPVIKVGAQEAYEPRCRKHHIVPGRPTLES